MRAFRNSKLCRLHFEPLRAFNMVWCALDFIKVSTFFPTPLGHFDRSNRGNFEGFALHVLSKWHTPLLKVSLEGTDSAQILIHIHTTANELWSLSLNYNTRGVALLLWALPIPHRTKTIETYWELSHLVSNHESCRFLLSVEMQKS